MTKFRMRGVRRLEVDGRVVTPLLSNVLAHSQRHSFEAGDSLAAEKARRIILDVQEKEVSDMVKKVLPNPPEGELGELITALVGILVGFRVRGRILAETKEFSALVDLIY